MRVTHPLALLLLVGCPTADPGTPEPTPDVPPQDDSWPDTSVDGDVALSVVHDGRLVLDGEQLAMDVGPAGLPGAHELQFVVTNRSETTLDLAADLGASTGFAWSAEPPTSLDPKASATFGVAFDPGAQTDAGTVTADLTLDDFTVILSAEVDRPLRMLVIGDGGYTAVSDDYGDTWHSEVDPASPRARWTVTWGEGRFFRGSAAGPNWADPGRYAWSEDGVDWHDATVNDLFWPSVCRYALERFVCARESSFSWSDGGESVVHESGGWEPLINGMIWTGTQFVGVGRGGRRALSDDGLTWTYEAERDVDDYFNDVAMAPDGTLVAVGGNNRFLTSVSTDDGLTWTNTNLEDRQYAYLYDVVWWNGAFYAAGQREQNTIVRSADGLTWTDVPTTNWDDYRLFEDVRGELFGAVNANGMPGEVIKTADGETWETVFTLPEGVFVRDWAIEDRR